VKSRVTVAANALVAAGAIVGGATVLAVATGYEIHLTAEMVQLLIYKGLAAASIGLIAAGTWIGRAAKRDAAHDSQAYSRHDSPTSLLDPPSPGERGNTMPARGAPVREEIRRERPESRDQ
jgi:hypothetical protein